MHWHRLLEHFGRASLVGTTVRDPQRLPAHLAADEHHLDWAGQKGYAAVTAGGGCLLGVALVASADEEHLAAAYGDFAAEAQDVDPGYAPQTVNLREIAEWGDRKVEDLSNGTGTAARFLITQRGT